jgi:hypothetical protein
MKPAGTWTGTVMALFVMLLVGVAVVVSTDSVGAPVTGPALGASADFASCDDAGAAASQAAIFLEATLDLEAPAPEPAAICRLIPQCSSNSDCDVQCGAGLGKCVHSNCPIRICRCR